MEDLLEMKVFTPTAPDNIKGRLVEFMSFGTAQFMQRASMEILISLDKNNVEAKKYSKYLAKIIDVGATGLGFVGGLGPMAKGIGAVSGIMTEELINEIVKKKGHKNDKTLLHYRKHTFFLSVLAEESYL